MATIVEELVGVLGWDVKPGDMQKLDKFEKSIDKVLGAFVKLGAAAGAAVAALVPMTAKINQQTTENFRLARSVDLSIESYSAWVDILDDIGMGGSEIIKMMKTMNKNIGELRGRGEYKEMSDALKMVGLRMRDLQDLAPEEQLTKILDTAVQFGDPQIAQGAVSKIMGRNAPLVLGYLRDVGMSMTEILERSKAMIFITEQGARGAEAWAIEWDALNTFLSTAKQEMFGLIGEGLSPLLRNMTEWIRKNRELVQTKIREWADRLAKAVEWLWDKIQKIARAVDRFITRMGGLENVFKLIGALLAGLAITKVILVIVRLSAAFKTMGTAAALAQAKLFLIPLAIAAIILAIDDILGFIEGKDSVTEKIVRAIGEATGQENIDQFVENTRQGMADLVEIFQAAFSTIAEFVAGAITKMVETIATIVEFVAGVFSGDWQAAWDKLLWNLEETWGSTFDTIKGFLTEFANFAEDQLSSLVEWISDNVTSPIAGLFKGMAREIREVVASVPVIGGLFDQPERPITRSEAIASIGRGPGIGAGAQATGPASVNNRTDVKASFGDVVVNAARGQSPEQIGQAVLKELSVNMARAVRANASGREY